MTYLSDHGFATTPPLFGRDRELARIDAALQGAERTGGHTIVVRGHSGMGKSRLLHEAELLAASAGARVLIGRGPRRPRAVPLEPITQLLAPLAVADDQVERGWFRGAAAHARSLVAGDVPDRLDAVQEQILANGLLSLALNLAAESPLLMIVDDVDNADSHTLRCLTYLASQIENARIVLIVSITHETAECHELISEVGILEHGETIDLAPFGVAETSQLLGAGGYIASPRFVDAMLEQSAGNPSLIRALLDAIHGDGILARDDQAAVTRQIVGAKAVAIIRGRLARLGPEAAAVAHAVRTLGPEATTARLIRVTELEPPAVASQVERLRRAFVIDERRLAIRAPLLERAMATVLRGADQDELEFKVAQVLVEDGVPAGIVAAHLMTTQPAGRALTTQVLLEAGLLDLDRGNLVEATRDLGRALDEGCGSPARTQAEAALVCVTTACRPDAAVADADRAVARLADREQQAMAYGRIGTISLALMQAEKAAHAFERGLALLEGADATDVLLELEAGYAAAALEVPGLAAQARKRLALRVGDGRPVPPGLAVRLAVEIGFSSVSRDEAVRLVRRAHAAGILDAPTIMSERARLMAVSVLIWSDEPATARQLCEGPRVSRWAAAEFAAHGAELDLLGGRIARAIARAEAVLDRDGAEATEQIASAAVIAAMAHLECGDPVAARRALARVDVQRAAGIRLMRYLDAAGWIELVEGDVSAALANFEASQMHAQAIGAENPAVATAQLGCVIALGALGRRDEARAIADGALQRARRFGAPRTIAAALRTAARVAERDEALGMLEEAAEATVGSDCELERAKTLLAYGSLLRRTNHRAQCQVHLRLALELAHRMGSARLEKQVRAELNAVGIRPRNVFAHGPAALTAAERRVAQLAARGYPNRAIAGELFLTQKTVEWHLRNIFMKLGIRRRQQLALALDDGVEAN